jgi:hypothetical protein
LEHASQVATQRAERLAFAVLREALERLDTKATPFAELLAEAGYSISDSAVRGWVRKRGRGMPAWALLAIAEVGGVSLDSHLSRISAGSDEATGTADAQDRELLYRVAERQEFMMQALYAVLAKLGMDAPNNLDEDK